MPNADYGVPGAGWVERAGLAVLPWAAARSQPDPHASVVRFGDAVYALAVQRGGWRADAWGDRPDGWYASRRPVPATAESPS